MTNKLFKNAIKFTSNGRVRPILSGLHFSEDGNVYATNPHIALVLEGFNKSKADFVLDPKSLEQLEGKAYPRLTRLIPSQGTHEVPFPVDTMKELVAYLKSFKKEYADLVFSDNCLKITIGSSEMKASINYSSSEPFKVSFSTDYLLTCMQLFIDEKLDTTFRLTSPVRPCMFYTSEIKALITPIRRGR